MKRRLTGNVLESLINIYFIRDEENKLTANEVVINLKEIYKSDYNPANVSKALCRLKFKSLIERDIYGRYIKKWAIKKINLIR